MNIDAIKKAAGELADESQEAINLYECNEEDGADMGIRAVWMCNNFASALADAMEEEPDTDYDEQGGERGWVDEANYSEAVKLLRQHKHTYPVAMSAWRRDRDALLARIDAKGGGA